MEHQDRTPIPLPMKMFNLTSAFAAVSPVFLSSFKRRTRKVGAQGFTMIELLVVISLMALLLVLAGPAMSSLEAQHMSSTLNEVQSVFDVARGVAASQNTYVWVAMGNVATPTGNQLWYVIFSSTDGTNVVGWSPATIDLTQPNSSLQIVTPPAMFNHVNLTDVGQLAPPSLPSLTTVPLGLASTSVNIRTGSGTVTLDRLIQFQPTGFAQAQNSMTQYIEFGLVDEQNAKDFAVMRVSGITGKAFVYSN